MERSYPAYYRDFHCLASACPDSCCKEWTVDIDPDAAQRYRALSGPLGDRLRQVLEDTDSGTVMAIENGRCPMWRRDGLCQIQAELGHDALCQVCREYPRLRHEYGSFEELGLELSCPEAARLILTSPVLPPVTETVPDENIPSNDPQALEILLQSRKVLLELLENEQYSLPQILAITLLYSYDVQLALNTKQLPPLDPAQALASCEKYAAKADIQALFDYFKTLEILTDEWSSILEAGPQPPRWTSAHRALARYFINRYWLQSVWDYEPAIRIKLTAAACLMVSAIKGDPIKTAQLFSKEIENDPDNVEAILDDAYASPALTDAFLLGLLLR
ncbi:MAG: flagellin lysine-N-methylase [Oscillospiraceae bacterium]|nr:flagellin lysine-N-methylase [Oscillospiraceae bacterium]